MTAVLQGVVVNNVCMSNFQLCFSPSIYLQTFVTALAMVAREAISWLVVTCTSDCVLVVYTTSSACDL